MIAGWVDSIGIVDPDLGVVRTILAVLALAMASPEEIKSLALAPVPFGYLPTGWQDLQAAPQEDNLDATVAPDVFVVLGAPNHDRDTYSAVAGAKDARLRVGGDLAPHLAEDQGRKRTLYRALGVAEYWQYDPTGDYLQPPLQGLRKPEPRAVTEVAPETQRGVGGDGTAPTQDVGDAPRRNAGYRM